MSVQYRAATMAIADTEANKPTDANVFQGMQCLCLDSGMLYRCTATSPSVTWVCITTSGCLSLASNLTNNGSTAAKVTGLDMACGVGTWAFQYLVRYQMAAVSTGVKFSVNHSGTLTAFVCNQSWVAAAANSIDAAVSQNQLASTGAPLRAFSARAKGTAGLARTLSADTANADMLMLIDGLLTVSATGNIELWHGSGAAAASTVMAGSSLILTKTT